ncbi:hypothetical protein ASG25_03505 [Rhizobium sp. Leaf384]|uniref:DUF1491 family protein n=1 Tax=unclassified Rhizobium TaxID=2613769 RepID=UPI000712FF70|nr:MULTISPECIES: DUF1491 family protein [unclassified Rhizobium]KQR77362.1 hypothetical protein ASG03_12985 [Rhizobium sp. Leaf341]KQS77450.1 hypothetical protein ASG58_10820 [Rhizobium sp. Leaf383]KQS80642.1 hypothetical protein ASG25_03505 [Rhizobium sp. Leaf384]
MRLRSDIFVSAITRRVFARGEMAAVLRKGSDAAGAIFIRQRARDGRETLFGPAPQSLVTAEDEGQRLFECRLSAADPEAVDAALAREIRFDPDCWVVELETSVIADLFETTTPDA